MTSIPYLHVDDAAAMVRRVIERDADLDDGEILLASADGCVTHWELYDLATNYQLDHPKPAIGIPKPLCRIGIPLINLFNRLHGKESFERPWMVPYIDRRLCVDAARTRRRLDWKPRGRLELLRRLPLMIENFKADPVEWNRVNRAAMKTVHMRPNLKIYWLMEKRGAEIVEDFMEHLTGPGSEVFFPTYRAMERNELQRHVRLILRHLSHTVRTRDRGVLLSYCRDLAERRFRRGFGKEEVVDALEALNGICVNQLRPDCRILGIEACIEPLISMSLRFGCDQVLERFEELERREERGGKPELPAPAPG
jgi:hypothetical protein